MAAIDFDLSYNFKGFINTIEEDKNYKTNDYELFDSWLNLERFELEIALAGQENMENFQYSHDAEDFRTQSEQQNLSNIINILMKDVLVESYRKAFDNQPLIGIDNVQYNNPVHQIIQMALMITEGANT